MDLGRYSAKKAPYYRFKDQDLALISPPDSDFQGVSTRKGTTRRASLLFLKHPRGFSVPVVDVCFPFQGVCGSTTELKTCCYTGYTLPFFSPSASFKVPMTACPQSPLFRLSLRIRGAAGPACRSYFATCWETSSAPPS